MARNKDMDSVEEVSPFPEGHEMNAWHSDGREVDIASERTRVDEKRPSTYKKYKSSLWFPLKEVPEGWQYAWFTERLLNEPQNDNLQEAYENGWDFVKQSDHPTYMVRELYGNPDDHIRRRNNILMKKPKSDYMADQRGHIEESAKKQKEISYLTDYFGTGPNDPRFIVENSGSYTPNYSDKRG